MVGYWNFNEGQGDTLNDLSVNENNGYIIGDPIWSEEIPVPPVLACTDPYADNYNPDATIDDGSCYGYPDNGNYALSFDGVDDYVQIVNDGIITNTGNFTNDFTISFSFKKYPNVQSYEGVTLVSFGDGTKNNKSL